MKQKLHLASCALLLLLLGAGACFGVTVTGHDGTRLSLSQIGDIVLHVTGQTFGELKFEKDSLYIYGLSYPSNHHMEVHSFNLDGSNNHLASIEDDYNYNIATPSDYQSISALLTSAPEGDDNKVLLNLFVEHGDNKLLSLATYMSGKPENGKLNMREGYMYDVRGEAGELKGNPLVDVKGGMRVKGYDGEVTAYLFRNGNTINLYLGDVNRDSNPWTSYAEEADSGEWSARVANADLPTMFDGTQYFPASMAVGDFNHDGYKNEIVVVYSDRSKVHYSVLQVTQLDTNPINAGFSVRVLKSDTVDTYDYSSTTFTHIWGNTNTSWQYRERGGYMDGISCTYSVCTVAGDFDGDGKDEFAVIWRDTSPNTDDFKRFADRREVLPLSDVVIVNEVEASEYLGVKIASADDAVREGLKVSASMKNTWVITMGGQGSVICSEGKSEIVRPYKVDAIETTGAGDSYIGGLGYALLQGMDIFTAAKFATKCSAVTVCGIGAQSSMPTLSQIHEKFGEE